MTPAPNRLPRLVGGIDLKTLPIGPAEAFVMSHVDGSSSIADIAAATGLPAASIERTLARLEELGALRFEPAPERAQPTPSRPAAAPSVRPVIEKVVASRHPSMADDDEDIDLDPIFRLEVRDLHVRLEHATHYEVLGVTGSADRRAVRQKYHELVNRFHPDRHYGKRLGSYKARLEKIFQRMTEAHDVLAREQARGEYDAYLKARAQAQALDRRLNDGQAHALESQEVSELIEVEAEELTDGSSSMPPVSRPLAPTSAPPAKVTSAPPAVVTSTPPPASRPSDPDLRRRALARKLRASIAPASARHPSPAPRLGEQAAERRQRYEQRLRDAKRRKAMEYVQSAERAEAVDSLAEAVHAMRVAVALSAGDAILTQRLAGMEQRAGRRLGEIYSAKGAYEEREGRFADAADSYSHALGAEPSAHLHERVAHCLLEAERDLKRSLEHAQRAVQLDPKAARPRLTLARAYIAARSPGSALVELDRAAVLAAGDAALGVEVARLRDKAR